MFGCNFYFYFNLSRNNLLKLKNAKKLVLELVKLSHKEVDTPVRYPIELDLVEYCIII